jgi:protease-4
MKNFWNAFFGTLLAITVFIVLSFFILIGLVTTLATIAEKPVKVKDNSVLMIKLDRRIVERKSENFLENIEFPGITSRSAIGLNQILRSIGKAKNDSRIRGIYLNLSEIKAGYATVEEIRYALKDFKESGKFIYSYSDAISQKAYYLASTADSLILNPHGIFDFRGLNAQRTFYKRAMEKFGIEMQIFRGKNNNFKAAVEPFMYEEMSRENREQTEVYLGSIWNHVLENISIERNIPVSKLNYYANIVLTFRKADLAKKYGFFNNLKYNDEVIRDLQMLTGTSFNEEIRTITISKYDKVSLNDGKSNTSDKIAVIYAEGDIDMGPEAHYSITSKEMSKAIRQARIDENTKAIVLRINSPGGSAFGSEVIWREVMLAAKEKPLIVSFGDYAASGGYYIACGAETIIANPTTITGSIGIFGMIPNVGELLNDKIGITFDNVKTNSHSDVPAIHRKMTPFEKNLIQKYVEDGYELFISRVAEGRKTSTAAIDKVGQGRVWSGINGKENGLVDDLGGISKAIKLAAREADIIDYNIEELPKEKFPLEQFFKDLANESQSRILRNKLGDTYQYWENLSENSRYNGIYARMPYSLEVN